PAEPPPPYEPPPAYSASAPGAPPPYTPGGSGSPAAGEDPPADRAGAAGGMDPRELTDFQLDELVHRIIGRVTRLVRTELRMDRERIGRLRDPRG
ncbi:extensin, partial [Streptomyces sp. PGLac3x]